MNVHCEIKLCTKRMNVFIANALRELIMGQKVMCCLMRNTNSVFVPSVEPQFV